MSRAILEELAGQIRKAAASEERTSAIRTLMQDSQSRKDEIADAIAALDERSALPVA